MKPIQKYLIIGLLVTAVAYGMIQALSTTSSTSQMKGDSNNLPVNMRFRPDRGGEESDSPLRKQRLRSRKLSNKEISAFLKRTIIPEINFEEIALSDALKALNEEIAKQTPDDQPRPKIRLGQETWSDLMNIPELGRLFKPTRDITIEELRVRNIPANILLQYVCDMTGTSFFCYKGDIYLSRYDFHSSYDFYTEEKFSRIKLNHLDASQLDAKFEEIIESHDYFGHKRGFQILMTERAQKALMNHEIQLPVINLEMKNITLREATMLIAAKSGGALSLNNDNLLFDPFDEVKKAYDPNDPNADPFAEEPSNDNFSVPLDENWANPINENDPFE